MEDRISTRICPKCKKAGLDTRVKRHLIIKLTLGWTSVKRYKCLACTKKSYIWNAPDATERP